MKIKYSLTKENKFKKISEINISDSYDINKKMDKESRGIIKFYNAYLIDKIIKKKMDIKFKKIFEMMIKQDESDDDPSEGLMICLSEANKIKEELLNKYRKFLNKKQQEFLEKKIMLLEEEIKVKLFNIQIVRNPFFMSQEGIETEYEEEKESTRRR